jgi:hypothetical protein
VSNILNNLIIEIFSRNNIICTYRNAFEDQMNVFTLIVLICISIAGCELILTSVESVNLSSKEWCFKVREKYLIQPGKSFGQLPFEMHNEYLSKKCYQYFCKPHPMAGRGVFDCEPLEQ